MELCDLVSTFQHTIDDQRFAYADVDIDGLSTRLGIKWEALKSIPFATEVLYLGFHWDLC